MAPLEVVRGEEVGAAAPRRDPVPRAGGVLVAGVVVLVPADDDGEPGLRVLQELVLEVGQVGVRRLGMRLHAVGPARLASGEDQPVALDEQRARSAEVGELRLVDVGVELDVDRPEPPAVGELDGEVAALLRRLPGPDPLVAAEDPHEVRQPVVPVVVAGDRVHPGRIGVDERERGPVGPDETVLVLGACGGGVDLVAAHDEDAAALGVPGAAFALEPQRRPGEEVRDRVGRLEPVAEVGHVVEPELLVVGVLAVGLSGRRQRGLDLALVRVGAEHRRDADLDSGAGELDRVEPAHHRAAVEAELLGSVAPRARRRLGGGHGGSTVGSSAVPVKPRAG